jgi:hypothetical protein
MYLGIYISYVAILYKFFTMSHIKIAISSLSTIDGTYNGYNAVYYNIL